MIYKLLFAGIILFAISCDTNNGPQDKNGDGSSAIKKDTGSVLLPAPPENCFRFVANRDTYDLNFLREGNIIRGSMRFNNFEKDKSSGTIDGTVNGDTLKIFYRFNSEGTLSVRQLYLKQEADKIITGTADEEHRADSAFIKKPSTVTFDGIIYEKINCTE